MNEDKSDHRLAGANTAPRCPICGKPRKPEHRPFCSRRCADIDLGRWLSESYAMPLPDHEAISDVDEPDR